MKNITFIMTMNTNKQHKTIWTIGHSTHTLAAFLAMLESFKIEIVADIRSFPGSRKFPQFNKEALEISLPQNNFKYVHLKKLGGRRKLNPHSKNLVWRHPAFRSYADYMETDAFKEGIQELEAIALNKRTVYMCSEAVWWRCHRSMVSDYLKVSGWNVLHIMGENKATEHPFTKPANVINGVLTYSPGTKEIE